MLQAGDRHPRDRATLSQVSVIRRAVGPQVRLKWSTPIQDLDRLLIAHAEGADRFHADAATILAEARRRAGVMGVRVPVPGVDY